MPKYRAYEQGVEVNGAAVRAIVDGLGSFRDRAEIILATNGILDPQPGRWYPQQAWLNAFYDIAASIGRRTLEQIGAAIPERAEWPREVTGVQQALESIDIAYHMNHRGGEIGFYRWVASGEREGLMLCRNPYPSAFDLGLITAVVRRHAPPGSSPSVQLDETLPGRDDGADSCTYRVRW